MARALWLLLFLGMASLAQAAGFLLGVPPIHSMRTLAERYEPLRAFLEARLGRAVYLESAADFADYHARTLAGEYDLAVTPAHFARIAQKERQFQPLTQFQPDHDALLLHTVEAPLQDLSRLKGGQLAVIDPLAITVMASVDYLERQGLELGRDYQMTDYRNHASVAQAMAAGLAVAGVSTTQGLKQMPGPVRARLRVRAHIADIPAFVILAKPQASAAEVARTRNLLLEFARGTAGQDFLRDIAYTALVPAEEASMRRADAYLRTTRKMLAR